MKQPVYKRQGFILSAYMKWRKTPLCWITLPFGIYVPRQLWDSNIWQTERYRRIRLHEETHFFRVWSRPYLSALWWPLHYVKDIDMVLDEEVVACRIEISDLSVTDKLAYAQWFADALITDYGIKRSRDEIVQMILK